ITQSKSSSPNDGKSAGRNFANPMADVDIRLPERGDELRGRKSSPPLGDWATHAALLLVQFAFASQAVEAKVAMMPHAQGGFAIAPEALAMARMLGGALFFQVF